MTFSGVSSTAPAANSSLVGKFTLTLSKTGSFSASLALGTETIRFTGRFDDTGRALMNSKRKDGTSVSMHLRLSRKQSGGEVVEGEVADFAGRSATIIALAPFFSSGVLPANHFNGTYHSRIRLASLSNMFVGAIPPSGMGFFTTKVSLGGQTAISGKVSDGTEFSGTVTLGDEGQFFVHFPLYGGKGFLSGSAIIDASTFATTRRSMISNLRWKRHASPGPYPAGFELNVESVGEQYVPRPASLAPFGGVSNSSVIAEVGGGHLLVSEGSSVLNFSLAGKGQNIVGTFTNLKITVNRANGTFTGSFLPPPAVSNKVTSFQGVLSSETSANGFALIKNSAGLVLPSAINLHQVMP